MTTLRTMMRTRAAQAGLPTLRPATAEDARLLWEWRQDPVVQAASFSSERIPWERHQRWLARQLASPDCRIWVAERHGHSRGQIRYVRSGSEAELSYSVAAAHRGQGWGTAMLRASAPRACRELGVTRVFGFTKCTNPASIRSFQRAGFRQARAITRQGSACLEFEWRP